MLIKNIIYNLILVSFIWSNHIPLGSFSIARIQYDGGGDWYSDETSIPNLLEFISLNTNIITQKKTECS